MDVDIVSRFPRRRSGRRRSALPTRLLVAITGGVLALASHGAPAQVSNYVVGPQDVLMITVFDQQDLGGKYTVDADGTVSFPLIGRLKAAGLVTGEMRTDVRLRCRLYEWYFKDHLQ